MLAINQLLQNRYRIVRQLGYGGMGAVYEAIDERFGEPIALKEIIVQAVKPDQKESILRAFEREAKSLAKAQHESIPYVRDYFSEFSRQFLVMELVEGDDLAELVEKRRSPFPVEDVLDWLDQLLDTLDYLHSLKPPIIHRDIKPQNLKLNSRRRIKLLDFGVAKNLDVAATVSDHTFIGATLDYSPIEQILRVIDPTFREFIILKHPAEAGKILQQDTDGRCDIYALGATFYHLLTGSPPADSTKRAVEVWSGKADPLISPSVLNPKIPPGISRCLLKAMEIERENRFASISEMQKAIQAAKTDKESGVPKSVQTGAETISFNSEYAGKSHPSNPTIAHNSSREKTLVKSDGKKNSAKKAWWLFPVVGVLVLAAVGIAVAMLALQPDKTEIKAPVSNVSTPIPAESFADTPINGSSNSPVVSNVSSPTPTIQKEETKIPAKTPKPDAVRTKTESAPKTRATRKTEKSKPARNAAQDPNCVFTNSCQ